MVEVFPPAPADGQGEGDCLVECVLADWFVGGAEESGQHVVAVFGGVVGEPGPYYCGAGGHYVGEVGGLIGGGARLDFAGPAGDKWYAVSCFPLVAFHSPPGPCSVVVPVLSHIYDRRCLGAVVGGEDDEGVVGDGEFVEGLH